MKGSNITYYTECELWYCIDTIFYCKVWSIIKCKLFSIFFFSVICVPVLIHEPKGQWISFRLNRVHNIF